MHVLILVNPISGRGQSAAAADRLSARLTAEGHRCEVTSTRAGEPEGQWLEPMLAGRDLLVVAGGDGTVRSAAAPAGRAGIPMYHLPYGTENLFARDWGMTRSEDLLVAAIAEPTYARLDLCRANSEPFLLMASVGFDAEVVDELMTHRRGPITHLSYARPIMRCWVRWSPQRLEVTVDGRRIDAGKPGFVVVGNCRQYGARIDPALRADMTNGQLDVVYYPTGSRWGLLRWLVATRCRAHVRSRRLVYVRGREVEVRSPVPVHYQLDGDQPHVNGSRQRTMTQLSLQIEPAAVPVLVPKGHEAAAERRGRRMFP
ncbi:MAG: diacylglycerol/lipid kinase family protein [Planctomycetota bacterium]|jgi:diacylglycerol kinase family enzyme